MILGSSSRTRRPLAWLCCISPQKTAIFSQMSVLTRHSNGFLGRTWEDRSWSFDNLLRGKGRTKPHGIQQHSCHGKQGCLTAWLTERTGNRTEARGGCEETRTPNSMRHTHYRWSKGYRQRRALKEKHGAKKGFKRDGATGNQNQEASNGVDKLSKAASWLHQESVFYSTGSRQSLGSLEIAWQVLRHSFSLLC